MSHSVLPVRRLAALGCTAAVLAAASLAGAQLDAASAHGSAYGSTSAPRAKAPARWMAGMNIAAFQRGDYDAVVSSKTAPRLKNTMGIDRLVLVPTLYYAYGTGHITRGSADGNDAGHQADNNAVSDAGIAKAAKAAKAAGLKVSIKPHVNWGSGPKSRTTINPPGRTRATFWKDYHAVLLHYAGLAKKVGADYLVVGTELTGLMKSGDTPKWTGLIADIRKVYGGKLTFAANYDAIAKVRFWGELDAVAADYFFSGRALGTVYGQLERTAAAATPKGLPFFFTEIGYVHDDARAQATKYQAGFDHAVKQDDARFAGFWFYDWYAKSPAAADFDDDAFTVRAPAAKVLCTNHPGC